jgi:hypothetical protein
MHNNTLPPDKTKRGEERTQLYFAGDLQHFPEFLTDTKSRFTHDA